MQLADRPLIAHIIDRLPPDGAERLLVDTLGSRGADFRDVVLCLVEGGALEAELQALGVPVVKFNKRGRYDVRCLWRLVRWLRRERPLAVHTHLFTADTWGRVAAWIARVPGIFTTVHSDNLWKGRGRVWVDRLLAHTSTRIVACSGAVARSLMERHRIDSARIECIANGVDLARITEAEPVSVQAEFGFPPGVPVIAVIGRLHAAKGHLDLLPALARLREEGLEYRALFVGEGELRGSIEAAIAERKLGAWVILTGQRQDVSGLLATVDVVVMPSRWEGLPMALLESMARSRAIVATAVGGIPDALRDRREGLLVPPGDPDRLTAALGELIHDPGLRHRLGEQAARRVRQTYDVATTARAYEKLYLQVAAGRR